MFDLKHGSTVWRKSSRSGPNGGNCVEVAVIAESVAVRDSKDPHGGHLRIDPTAWMAFLSHVTQTPWESN